MAVTVLESESTERGEGAATRFGTVINRQAQAGRLRDEQAGTRRLCSGGGARCRVRKVQARQARYW